VTTPAASGPDAAVDVRAIGDRVQTLIAELRRSADPDAGARAGELVRLLMDLYGEALARIVSAGGVESLLDDEIVSALLVLHDLHPLSPAERVARALARVEPLVAPFGAIAIAQCGAESVRLRFEAGSRSPGASAGALRSAIVRAVEAAAPELETIAVDGLEDPAAGPQPLTFFRATADGGAREARS
jgi:hypothetical protein